MPYNVFPRAICEGSAAGRCCPGTNPPDRRPAGDGPCAIASPTAAAATQLLLTHIFHLKARSTIVNLFIVTHALMPTLLLCARDVLSLRQTVVGRTVLPSARAAGAFL